MSDQSAIQWTEATWNPIVGCSRVSEGCRNCYAERVASRFGGGTSGGTALWSQYEGLVKTVNGHPQWTGEVRLVESALDRPLHWKKPRRIFVNSMSDLFHEKVPDEWLDRIFDVMRRAHQHTFQILTKRPERMHHKLAKGVRIQVLENVWWGVSVENQPTADERITLLLQTPAALRWVSYEPALRLVDFRYALAGGGIKWIVVGGESGPGARPFDLAWARQTIAQCRAAGVPVFVKQLGARPYNSDHLRALNLRDSKGGDPAEWPLEFCVREYPTKGAGE